MATMTVSVEFESDDGTKGTKTVTQTKGIDYNHDASEAIDGLVIDHIGPAVRDWRNGLRKKDG